jgi:GAF domain-containing protein
MIAPVYCPRCRIRRGESVELVTKQPRPRPNAGDTGERVEGALRAALARTAMDVAVLAEIADDREVVRALAGDGESFGLSVGVSTPIDATYCQRLLDGRLSGIVRDARSDERVRDLESTRVADIGAYLGVPLTGAAARLYVLCCLAHEQRQSLSERDLQALRAAGRTVIAALGPEAATR